MSKLWCTDKQRELASLSLKLTGLQEKVSVDSILDAARRKEIYKDMDAAVRFLKRLDSSDSFPLQSETDEYGHRVFSRKDVEVYK